MWGSVKLIVRANVCAQTKPVLGVQSYGKEWSKGCVYLIYSL